MIFLIGARAGDLDRERDVADARGKIRALSVMTRLSLIPVLFIGLLLFTTAVYGQDNPALYQATAIVTGTDMRQRPVGFARCFTEVMVKVSGAPRLQGDPEVAALAEHADTMVDSFSPFYSALSA